jgi:hypothetical protein
VFSIPPELGRRWTLELATEPELTGTGKPRRPQSRLRVPARATTVLRRG